MRVCLNVPLSACPFISVARSLLLSQVPITTSDVAAV